ncbi:MAG: transposase family protein [Rickettsiales bacterium]|jgi:hypothetical protein|nr:transposase family protein [Rickettsiales bacterium]
MKLNKKKRKKQTDSLIVSNAERISMKLNKEEEETKTGRHFIKLSIEDKLLLALEYLRENRTFYHIAGRATK